jgi:putative ABC transport system permease protein
VDGSEASKIVSLMGIDADYIPLMQMEFREGRNFIQSGDTQPESGVILNEACVSFLGLGDTLVGKRIPNIEILGVLKSGKYNSLHEDPRPIAFYSATSNTGYMNVRLDTDDIHSAIAYIEDVYLSFFENIPFEYTFLDQTVERMYQNDINQSKLLGVFTGLSIVIANIGLFGLVALLNRKRIKEIGIRKVNGARKSQIVLMLVSQLLIWVIIAVVIAIPVSWYVTERWLQNFASQATLSWWIIPLGGLIILSSALLTTAFITLRAAHRNPVDTLRYE